MARFTHIEKFIYAKKMPVLLKIFKVSMMLKYKNYKYYKVKAYLQIYKMINLV